MKMDDQAPVLWKTTQNSDGERERSNSIELHHIFRSIAPRRRQTEETPFPVLPEDPDQQQQEQQLQQQTSPGLSHRQEGNTSAEQQKVTTKNPFLNEEFQVSPPSSPSTMGFSEERVNEALSETLRMEKDASRDAEDSSDVSSLSAETNYPTAEEQQQDDVGYTPSLPPREIIVRIQAKAQEIETIFQQSSSSTSTVGLSSRAPLLSPLRTDGLVLPCPPRPSAPRGSTARPMMNFALSHLKQLSKAPLQYPSSSIGAAASFHTAKQSMSGVLTTVTPIYEGSTVTPPSPAMDSNNPHHHYSCALLGDRPRRTNRAVSATLSVGSIVGQSSWVTAPTATSSSFSTTGAAEHSPLSREQLAWLNMHQTSPNAPSMVSTPQSASLTLPCMVPATPSVASTTNMPSPSMSTVRRRLRNPVKAELSMVWKKVATPIRKLTRPEEKTKLQRASEGFLT